MISVEGLTVEFGGFTLFDDVSFVVNKKDRIALVGKNGAGKSTMLKIFAGLQSPTSGTVSIPKETTIGYLPQQMQLTDSRTVREEAEQAFGHIQEMEKDIERLNLELAERTDYETESYQKLIDKVTHLSEHFQLMGGSNYHAELERTLIGLGFNRSDFERPTSEFSGGWRMRIELAKLLLRRPDVLLLDEPTNHLDIESIQWLENFIATRANAVILVSHDRAFIDNTTSRTIEIELGSIYDYKVKYSEYVELRKERREQQLRAFENQQKKLADTEAFIERFRYKANNSVQYVSVIRPGEDVAKLVKRMHYVSFVGMFRSDLFEGLCVGHAPKKCRICGKWFLTTNARHTKYCGGYAPICMTCGRVGSWKGRPTFEELAVMFEGSTASGAERAYRRAVDKLTEFLVSEGAIHAVRLKQKTKTKHKKKIAAAIYEYQADCDGEWGEISVDFENGTAEIIRLADWDTIKTNWFAKEAIRHILSLSPDALTKYMLVPLEPPLIS